MPNRGYPRGRGGWNGKSRGRRRRNRANKHSHRGNSHELNYTKIKPAYYANKTIPTETSLISDLSPSSSNANAISITNNRNPHFDEDYEYQHKRLDKDLRDKTYHDDSMDYVYDHTFPVRKKQHTNDQNDLTLNDFFTARNSKCNFDQDGISIEKNKRDLEKKYTNKTDFSDLEIHEKLNTQRKKSTNDSGDNDNAAFETRVKTEGKPVIQLKDKTEPQTIKKITPELNNDETNKHSISATHNAIPSIKAQKYQTMSFLQPEPDTEPFQLSSSPADSQLPGPKSLPSNKDTNSDEFYDFKRSLEYSSIRTNDGSFLSKLEKQLDNDSIEDSNYNQINKNNKGHSISFKRESKNVRTINDIMEQNELIITNSQSLLKKKLSDDGNDDDLIIIEPETFYRNAHLINHEKLKDSAITPREDINEVKNTTNKIRSHSSDNPMNGAIDDKSNRRTARYFNEKEYNKSFNENKEPSNEINNLSTNEMNEKSTNKDKELTNEGNLKVTNSVHNNNSTERRDNKSIDKTEKKSTDRIDATFINSIDAENVNEYNVSFDSNPNPKGINNNERVKKDILNLGKLATLNTPQSSSQISFKSATLTPTNNQTITSSNDLTISFKQNGSSVTHNGTPLKSSLVTEDQTILFKNPKNLMMKTLVPSRSSISIPTPKPPTTSLPVSFNNEILQKSDDETLSFKNYGTHESSNLKLYQNLPKQPRKLNLNYVDSSQCKNMPPANSMSTTANTNKINFKTNKESMNPVYLDSVDNNDTINEKNTGESLTPSTKKDSNDDKPQDPNLQKGFIPTATSSKFVPASISVQLVQSSVPQAIIDTILPSHKGKPVFMKERNYTILDEISFYSSTNFAKATNTLNIFKFDHTMISTLTPNVELYTDKTYATIASRHIDGLNWYQDVLPNVDARFVKGGLIKKKGGIDPISSLESSIVFNDPAYKKAFDKLKYKWSQVLLLFVQSAAKTLISSNLLFVDRPLLFTKFLADDLKILSSLGIRFHYVVEGCKTNNDPNYMLLCLLDEIYKHRFDWCKSIKNIKLFDHEYNLDKRMKKSFNPKSSNINFEIIRTPKNSSYFKNPGFEVKIIVESNTFLKVRDSITISTLSAALTLDYHSMMQLRSYLTLKNMLPEPETIFDYTFNFRNIILSKGGAPARLGSIFRKDIPYSGSILRYGKLDKTVYAVQFLINADYESWEYDKPTMIIAKHSSILYNVPQSLIRNIKWTVSDSNLDLTFNFCAIRKLKITKA